MTNKKLWIKVLAVIAVVCLLSCMFVACKKAEDPTKKKPEPAEETPDVITPLLAGVQKSIANGDMENLLVSAKLDLDLKNGEATSKYTIALDLGLNLFNGSNEAAGDEATYLNAEIIKNDKDLLLGLYYSDWSEKDQGIAAMDKGALYLQAKSGAEQKKIQIPVPNVNSAMRALDAKVDFSNIDLSDEDLFGDTSSIAGIINALLTIESETKFSLDLGALLDPTNENGLGSLLAGISGTFKDLNLDIEGDKLGEILPNISITFEPKYASSGALTKLNLGLKISDKDIVINKTNANKDPFLIVGMNGPVEVGASLAYTVGGNSLNEFDAPLEDEDFEAYAKKHLLNVSFDATLELNEAIALELMKGMNIDLPAGNYTLTVRLDADPTQVLKNLYSYTPATTYDATTTYFKEITKDNLYVRAADGEVTASNVTSYFVRKSAFSIAKQEIPSNATEDEKKTIEKANKKATIEGIIDIAGNILGCVDAIELVLKEAGGSFPLKIIAAKDNSDLHTFKATIDAGIIKKGDGTPLLGTINGMPIKDLVTTVKNAIVPILVKEDAVDAKTTDTLKTVGTYLLGAYIGINANAYKEEYAKGIEAKVNIPDIPFSGYTEFKGSYNDAYTYYMPDPTAFIEQTNVNPENGFENVTSYTLVDGLYIPYEDEENKGPQAGVTYYKLDESKPFIKVETIDATTFNANQAKGMKYYVAGSDKATGEDIFGIGIVAELRVNAEEKFIIKATATGLDVFGLPGELKVTISATGAGLFNYDVPTYEELTAKVY